jgi:hypothetical protein
MKRAEDVMSKSLQIAWGEVKRWQIEAMGFLRIIWGD